MKTFSERIPGLFAAIIISGFVLVGCDDQDDPPDHYVDTPIAGFTYTGNDGPAPVQIQFYNTSLNADKFEWDFGDGTTATVTGTIAEEDCDGEGLKHALQENSLRPDFAVICEPSSNTIITGHKGKAQALQAGPPQSMVNGFGGDVSVGLG